MCAPAFSAAWAQTNPFTLGIASGSPRERSVVLWTRLAPEPLRGGGMPPDPVAVRYRVCSDPDMRRTLQDATTVAVPEQAHSVHVQLAGLEPGRDYWYQFYAGDHESPIGHTKTASLDTQSVRLAIAACQHFEHGEYAAYRDIAEWSPDCVVHLGDYIYEYGAEPIGVATTRYAGVEMEVRTVRQHEGAEIRTLRDYRNRYALYRSDPDLRNAHAACPWLVSLDDHEIANNWAGYVPADPVAETALEFAARRVAALEAFYEHMPIERAPVVRAVESELALFGGYRFGPAHIHMLDTRQYRTDQVCGQRFPSAPACDALADSRRTMTGRTQERWLLRSLRETNAPFAVLAQQTWFAPYDYDPAADREAFNMDQWDGYPVQRQRLIDALAATAATPIVLSGDWHCAAAMTIHRSPRDASSPVVGHEFATTSISSHCVWTPAIEAARAQNPHVGYVDGKHRGYLRCSVDRDRWTTQFRVVDDAGSRGSPVRTDNELDVGARRA